MNFSEFLQYAPAVSAIASAIAAVVATLNVIIQNKNTRRNRAIDLLIKKEAEFDSPRLIKHRCNAAKALLANSQDTSAVEAVLDFMESVARFVAEKDMTVEQVWCTFHHWFAGYYYAAENLIESERKIDASIWEHLVELHVLMEKLQVKRGNPLRRNLKIDVKYFLTNEAALGVE